MSAHTLGVCFAVGASLVNAQSGTPQTVTVYLNERITVPEMQVATATAASIFRLAGVRIRWAHGHPDDDGPTISPIALEIVADAPAETPRGVRARSFPYANGGTQIVVYRNRVLAIAPEGCSGAGKVLGHVLAHEITHVLQGISRHSPAGLMAAHWSTDDVRSMQRSALRLLSHDVELIQGAGVWRNSTLAKRLPAAIP